MAIETTIKVTTAVNMEGTTIAMQRRKPLLAQPVGEREIRIVDERFTPNTITIQAGESVTFVNADDDEHTATGPGFDTGKMLPGDSVTITFDTPGTYDFVCQFHSEMRGTVIVEGTGTPVASPVASPVGSPSWQLRMRALP